MNKVPLSRREKLDITDDLFELAVRSGYDGHRVVVPAEWAEEFDWISHLLDVIDASWTSTPAKEDAVWSAFTRKVWEELGEVWGELRPVATLGDLVETRGEELPALALMTLRQLKEDTTPISRLKDPTSGVLVVTKALRRAGVPKTFLADLLNWLRRILQDTIDNPRTPGSYLVRSST